MTRSITTLPPPDGMPVYRKVTPPPPQVFRQASRQFDDRGIVGVKCLAQEHKTMTRPGLEPRPLDPDSGTLTMKPMNLPYNNK